jgi:hypothetical protein
MYNEQEELHSQVYTDYMKKNHYNQLNLEYYNRPQNKWSNAFPRWKLNYLDITHMVSLWLGPEYSNLAHTRNWTTFRMWPYRK